MAKVYWSNFQPFFVDMSTGFRLVDPSDNYSRFSVSNHSKTFFYHNKLRKQVQHHISCTDVLNNLSMQSPLRSIVNDLRNNGYNDINLFFSRNRVRISELSELVDSLSAVKPLLLSKFPGELSYVGGLCQKSPVLYISALENYRFSGLGNRLLDNDSDGDSCYPYLSSYHHHHDLNAVWFVAVCCAPNVLRSLKNQSAFSKSNMKSTSAAKVTNPFEFNSFPLDNKVAQNSISSIDVDNIYSSQKALFYMYQQANLTAKECPIWICNAPPEKDSSAVQNRMKKIEEEIRQIIDQNKEKLGNDYSLALDLIIGHLWRLMRCDFSLFKDAHFWLDILDSQEASALVAEAEQLSRQLMEMLGVFKVEPDGQCRIELYYDKIAETYEQHKQNILTNSEDKENMFRMVLAHEMMHAFHFAAVISAGGDWDGPNAFTCMAVEETIAEYYALLYSQKNGYSNIVKYINHIRNKSSFPGDGGYSGALLVQSETHYSNIFKTSLTDMEGAFSLIK